MIKKLTIDNTPLKCLEDTFGLRKTFVGHTLDNWLKIDVKSTKLERSCLAHFQENLILHDSAWNDHELAQQFIGPMLGLAHLTELYRFRLFSGYKLAAIVPTLDGEVELKIEPDGMIATGYREPGRPFFAYNQYKRQLDPRRDPRSQTLAAMLLGQTLTHSQHPIYGAYIIDYNWYFMTLDGKYYTMSRGYSALKEDIFDILRILKALKQIVMKLTE